MPTLDLYIFKDFIVVYICLTLAFCVLFLISDLINKLGDFGETNASWITIAYFFILKQPRNITFILPLSLLLSTMYTMARFGIHNEITAMRASGISLLRCGVTIYIVGLIVTGLNFWFNESLGPSCTREALIIRRTATDPDYIQHETRMLVYRTPNGQRTWLIKSFISGNVLVDIQMKKSNKKGDLILELYADKAIYSPNKGWEFIDTTLVKYKKISLMDNYSVNSLGEKQPIIVPISQKFAVFDKENREFSKLGHIFETPSDFLNAIWTPEEWTSADIAGILARAHDLSPATKSFYKTILYTRRTFPWVCLLSVLLAIPLAASNERHGIMVSVVSAVGVVIVYHVASQVFMVLGQKAYLPPIIAGTAPTIILALYVWYNIRRHK